ncbi:ribosome biogenesis GTP-binding protein YihA/YsxC [Athalassotoga sp.]|uniref:ribosome biogenesis GTP-binding protein YihA/YsxC n=1 Tax=Athalassotoga sp. TaxID=2022597 RepID=UPI003D00DE63
MFVEKVELIADAHNHDGFPEPLKGEIAFVGRSNVGKSSLLNVIFGRQIAKTSSTPGKTRSLLFFKVNDFYHFIDFPGYGYAKVSKIERQKWQSLVDDYFKSERPLKGIFLLVDSMIPTQRSDLEAFDFFKSFVDVFIVLTKVDRIKKNQISKKVKTVEEDFMGVKGVIPFSSITKDGLKEIEGILREIFENER